MSVLCIFSLIAALLAGAGIGQALAGLPPLTDAAIDRSERIVGMMGPEPFLRALDAGAQAAQPVPQAQAPASPAAAPAIPVLTATTREVLLDVVVTDANGAPVAGLTSADFAVSEEGELQHLTHVEEHRPMGAAELAALKALRESYDSATDPAPTPLAETKRNAGNRDTPGKSA